MIKIIAVLTLIGLQFIIACNQNDLGNRMISISPKNNADIVYFFKKEASNKAQNEFVNKDLYESFTTNSQRTGDGIMTFYRVVNNKYIGHAINYKASITPEQKEKITEIISHSPLVYKFYTNVVPSEIKDLK